MKGLVTLGVFALFYLLIIILFNAFVVAGEPRMVSSSSEKQNDDGELHNRRRAAPSPDPSSSSSTPASPPLDPSPLADFFQIADPQVRAAMNAVYGAYRGNDQCNRKAFCIMGNYMKDMPARDLVFYMMGQYIPPQYSLYYEIFKIAVLYGQNCDVYVCIPDSPSPPGPDAASAAAVPPSPPNPSPSTTTSKPSNPSPQKPQNTFPDSPSLSNAFPRQI